MKIRKYSTSILLIAVIIFGSIPSKPGLSAPSSTPDRQTLPPIIFRDDEFLPGDWTTQADLFNGGTFTASQQTSGGFTTPAFRFMSHVLPPVSGVAQAIVRVTHLSRTAIYNPSVQGAIQSIDYQEAGRILSFPFPEAFSTTQPALLQDGRLYRSLRYIRFIAQNSSHNWELQELTNLRALDFIAMDGSEQHPDFSDSGGLIRFGFTRTNTRSSTLPPVPPDQDLIIDQGVDNWQVTVHRQVQQPANRPPTALNDFFILDGNQHTLPLFDFFSPLRNDIDLDDDFLEVISITPPLHGEAELLNPFSIAYTLDVPEVVDQFNYTVSDGSLTDEAEIQVFVDCACTVLCLNTLDLTESQSSQAQENLDLPLIYRLRDSVMKPSPGGQRYVDMYYRSNPEILVTILMNEPLRTEAIATVELWQPNLRSLVDGDGSAVITQAQVDAIQTFLTNLSAASSPALQDLIASELDRLGPLDDYAGMTMKEAKKLAIGDATLYLPIVSSP